MKSILFRRRVERVVGRRCSPEQRDLIYSCVQSGAPHCRERGRARPPKRAPARFQVCASFKLEGGAGFIRALALKAGGRPALPAGSSPCTAVALNCKSL